MNTEPKPCPCRKIKVKHGIRDILRLPCEQRIISYSWDGSFRVWDLERGMQVGEEWEDKDDGVQTVALSPNGKTVITGSRDGAVKLWNVETGKVIKTLTGHTKEVYYVCWSPDGRRVVSASENGTFRVWDVKSGETILGPIHAGRYLNTVCYSPDAKMIATGGNKLKIWDAKSGELLKTIDCYCRCMAWTLNGKTLFAGWFKIDTATWTILDTKRQNLPHTVSLHPNERILASTSYLFKTAQLWTTESNQLIGTPLPHEDNVRSAFFSADGKLLVTSCNDGHLYTWDVPAIIKEAGFASDIVNITPRPAKGTRIPPGFFDDALREANLRIHLSQSRGSHNHPTPPLHRRIFSTFSSFLRRSKPHGTTERNTRFRSRPSSWTWNLSDVLRRRDRSDIELQEVPHTAGQPRNYHARKKKAASPSRPPNTHTTQPNLATQSATPTAGTSSSPRVTISGWRAHLVGWLCCVPIQNTNDQP